MEFKRNVCQTWSDKKKRPLYDPTRAEKSFYWSEIETIKPVTQIPSASSTVRQIVELLKRSEIAIFRLCERPDAESRKKKMKAEGEETSNNAHWILMEIWLGWRFDITISF